MNRLPLPEVLVLLGTDHHPFDRLVEWSRDCAPASGATWWVQYGSTPWPEDGNPAPREAEHVLHGVAYLSGVELAAALARASCVVTHGGPGLLMDAWLAGHSPVVVPRDPDLGEHVDHHQQRFVRHLAGNDRVLPATTRDELAEQVAHALRTPRVPAARRDTSATLERFAHLVEASVARRRPR